jgi:DNA polymerase III alpha subunit (gram-positive type)
MRYIVLDLEWNQAYQEKALAVQRQLETRLRGEVIQIGAVMLDEKLQICGSFRKTVKPKFYKRIHRHVMRLTGIDQAQIDRGTPLAEAMEHFHRFCTDDAVFLT